MMPQVAELKLKCLLEQCVPVVTVRITNDRFICVVTRSEEHADVVGRWLRMSKTENVSVKKRLDSFDGVDFWETTADTHEAAVRQLAVA